MNWTDFHFLRPLWLWALLPAIAAIVFMVRQRRSRGDWSHVCDAELLPYILDETPSASSPLYWPATAFASVLAILALAGPTVERQPGPAFRNQSALVIALDLSRSMDATDIKPSRVSRARYKIADILKQRKDGQTALLVYGGEAFTVTPLTSDTATINSQLEALTTDIMPSPGSNPVLAIKRATELLKQAGVAEGHILLITDGVEGRDVSAAVGAAGHYAVSVLALGTSEGAPIPVAGGGFLKDADGNIVVARLDADAVSTLALTSRGQMQIATNDDVDIAQLTAFFDSAARKAGKAESAVVLEQWDDLGPWLTLLIVPWAALRFRKGLLLLILATGLHVPREAMAFDWPSLWQTPNQRAQQAFDAQRYQQAADQFQDPAWRAAAQYRAGQYQQAADTLKDLQTADGHYNRGNALAKAGQLQEAVQAYQQALTLDPGHADARHNKELVEKQLEQQKQSSQDQSSSSAKQKEKENESDQTKDQKSDDAQNGAQADSPSDGNTPPPSEQNDPAKNDDKKQSERDPRKPDTEDNRPDDVRRPPKSAGQPEESSTKNAAMDTPEQQEAQRAAERLLKRIPDEPTGLLKRKFKYQYGQRDPPHPAAPTW